MHRLALRQFCHFINENVRIDITSLIKIQKERARLFRNEVVFILFDVAETIGRRVLAFKSHANDENDDVKEILCYIMKTFSNVERAVGFHWVNTISSPVIRVPNIDK